MSNRLDPMFDVDNDKPEPIRYFLGSDDDGHWYVVRESQRKRWEEWRDIDPEDERAWTPPPYAYSLGCSYTCVTFTDPRVD